MDLNLRLHSQILSLRERPYVEIARLSGLNDVQIIFQEILPNLLPYLAASFVGAVSGGLLAAVGLEALGLGPQTEPTLGMTITVTAPVDIPLSANAECYRRRGTPGKFRIKKGNGRYEFDASGPLLPYQGIFVEVYRPDLDQPDYDAGPES